VAVVHTQHLGVVAGIEHRSGPLDKRQQTLTADRHVGRPHDRRLPGSTRQRRVCSGLARWCRSPCEQALVGGDLGVRHVAPGTVKSISVLGTAPSRRREFRQHRHAHRRIGAILLLPRPFPRHRRCCSLRCARSRRSASGPCGRRRRHDGVFISFPPRIGLALSYSLYVMEFKHQYGKASTARLRDSGLGCPTDSNLSSS